MFIQTEKAAEQLIMPLKRHGDQMLRVIAKPLKSLIAGEVVDQQGGRTLAKNTDQIFAQLPQALLRERQLPVNCWLDQSSFVAAEGDADPAALTAFVLTLGQGQRVAWNAGVDGYGPEVQSMICAQILAGAMLLEEPAHMGEGGVAERHRGSARKPRAGPQAGMGELVHQHQIADAQLPQHRLADE